MKIAIGADHKGFMYKDYIKYHCAEYEWIDVGTFDTSRTDYPIYAKKVVHLFLSKSVECGVLLCSSGIGMAIAANRYPTVYAAVVWNQVIAQQAKAEDNINILVLPSDFVTCEEAIAIIQVWIYAKFKENRYKQRLLMIDNNT